MTKAFEWTENLSVGVTIIDEQHKYFIGLINRLSEVTDKHESTQVINDILKELRNYTIFHFFTEEKYFKKFAFIEADRHIEEHNKLKQIVDKFIERNSKKKNIYSNITDLTTFLIDWLVFHIGKSDRRYIDCFHKNGLF
jgi:methyl-accepting chemotaxis protein/hemerythrin